MVIKSSLGRLRLENCSGFQVIQDAIVRQHLRKEGKEGRRERRRKGGKEKEAMENPAPWLRSK